MESGATLEAVYKDGTASKIIDVKDLISFLESGDDIRVRGQQ